MFQKLIANIINIIYQINLMMELYFIILFLFIHEYKQIMQLLLHNYQNINYLD